MSNYAKAANFTAKDSLTTGDPSKRVLGSEIDTEFTAIETAIATKADLSSPTFTGTVTVPNPSDGSDTTVAASTAFVRNILPAGVIVPYGGSSAPNNWLLCDGAAVSRATYATLFAVVSTTYGAGDGSTTFNVPDLMGRAPIGAGTGTLVESTAAADVDTTANTFLVGSNVDKWITGMAVVLTTTSVLPAGLSLATTYYIIRSDATRIKFATTLANAVAGTAIDITSIGSGTHTITHTLSARTLGQKLGEETHALVEAEIPTHTHGSVADHTHLIAGFSQPGTGNNMGTSDGTGVQGTAITAAAGGHTHNSFGGNGTHNTMPPGLVINYIIKT